ncbi:ubiquitin family protein [Nitzschia inconspicua]|nr:ubiquitin family protein [Nitzschia inconspicua]
MLIKVQIPSRKEPIFLDVEDTDLVTDIKRRALKKSDTLIEDPFIVFGGIPLVSERSLSQCSIQHNDLLLLEEYRISVLHWDGEVFLLDRIRQRDTVAKVQQILLEAHDIPLEEQQLSFSGKRLQSSRTLMEEGVNHRAVLVLEPRNINIQLPNADKKVLKKLKTKTFTSEHEEIWPIMPDWKHRIFFFDGDDKIDASIELSVLHWSGERVLLQEILLTMKISEVKDKILKLHGIKKKKQKLSFQGKLLDDNRTLLDQGVKHKSVLTLESLKKNTIANPNLDRVLLNPLPAKLESHISISVMHWKGDSIQLHADPHEYIDDIKEKIADQLSIPVDYQRLIFHGSSTSDHLNLKEQNIVNGAVLELLQMEILVEVATRNSPISVLVEPDDKISRVKRNLAKKANIPVDMQCILLAGEELTDSRTLSSYNIEHGDTLVLEMFKVRILHWSGDQFDLDGLNPTATVQEVKAAIWKLSKVPILDQQLVLKGKTLNDVLGLREQGVAYRSVLILQEKKLIDSEKNENMKSKVSFRFLKTAGAIDPLLTPFPLEVKLWDDTSFFIDVSGSDYIDDVKDKIFAIEKIPLDYQLLHHKGQPVTIDSNLQNQGIKKGSCLCLTYVPVSIKLPSGQTVDLQLSYRDTIKRAKQLLKETSGILAKDQFLMMSGKELNDSMRVCDYGIDGDDILLLETFTIKVADWVGKLFEVIGLHPGNGLQDLNAKITDMKGIPAERQILKFNGRSMNSAASLKDQGIEHRSILVLEPPDDRIMSPTKEKLSFKFFSSALGPSKESYKVAQTPILCLHIKNSNGDMFLIKAQPTEYVEDIKEKICIKKKIPVNKQRLKFEGALLENTSTLQSLGICDGSVLFLGMIQIQVKLPNGTCIDVEVEVDDTVVRLKRRLKDLGGVSVENQFLMFGGQLLENTKKLSLYGIDHEDIIELEMFKVYIADWTGDVFEVSGIQPSNNISAVKDQIKAIRGIVPSQQILSANGQKLNEFLRLKDQGLKHRTILFLDSPSRMQSIIEVDNGKNQDEEREEITTATNSSLTSESKMNGKGGKMTRGENANGINRGKMKSKPLDEPSHTSKTKKLKRKKEIKESNK